MRDEVTQSAALVLLLGSLPLLSFGAWNDVPVLWCLGLAVLTVGALIPPVMRFVGDDEAEEQEVDP